MSNMKLSRIRKHKFFVFRFGRGLPEVVGHIVKRSGDTITILSENGFKSERSLDDMLYPPSLRFYNDNIVPSKRVK